MLLPTMTPEEIYAEMHKDAEWLENTINKKFVPLFQKGAKRATNFPYFKPFYDVSSKTLITYWVVMIAYHRSDWKKPRVAIFTKYSHEYGSNIIYIENDRFAIRLYTPHFLQRIKERCSAMNYKVPIEMNQYEDMMLVLCNRDVEELTLWKDLEKNHKDNEMYQELYAEAHQTKFWQDPDYERYGVACDSGLCLCERSKKNPNISIYNTIISPDMLIDIQRYDFFKSYILVFLRAMEREYPRQRDTWGREYEQLRNSTEDIDAFIKGFVDLMIDFAKRYPRHYF